MKPEFLEKVALSIVPVGSRVTCDPAPMNTDEDWLVLVKDFDKAFDILYRNGFDLDNPSIHYRPENSVFNSWRGPDSTNLIVTDDRWFYNKFLAATHVAKKLNIMNKQDRIMLFQAVLYGMMYDPDTSKHVYFDATPFMVNS